MGEIKRHPYTSVSALGCLLMCFVALPFTWNAKASAADVNALKDQIDTVRATVQLESATTELNNVRRELFDIDLRIRTLERENINVDVVLYKRRDDLQLMQRLLEAKVQGLQAVQSRRQ